MAPLAALGEQSRGTRLILAHSEPHCERHAEIGAARHKSVVASLGNRAAARVSSLATPCPLANSLPSSLQAVASSASQALLNSAAARASSLFTPNPLTYLRRYGDGHARMGLPSQPSASRVEGKGRCIDGPRTEAFFRRPGNLFSRDVVGWMVAAKKCKYLAASAGEAHGLRLRWSLTQARQHEARRCGEHACDRDHRAVADGVGERAESER